MTALKLPALAGTTLLLCVAATAGDIVDDAREQWSRLDGQALADDPFRDKKRLCTDLEIYEKDGEIAAKDVKSAAKGLLRLVKKNSPASLEWRVQELRGRLLFESNPAAADEAFVAALAAYPDESYAAPAMHSYFHHLVSQAAVARAEAEGFDSADAFLVDVITNDVRLQALEPSVFERHYLVEGEKERLVALYAKLATAVTERLPDVAGELSGRKIPDVRTIEGDKQKLFIVFGADRVVDTPRDLVVIMPGGNGQAFDFKHWLEGIATPILDQYVVAILNAPRWTPAQEKEWVWVTENVQRKYKAAFAVEDFARDVAGELKSHGGLDVDESFIFAWSSGGPAAYSTVLSKDDTFAGAYVVASVFKPKDLEVQEAEGRRFVLQQGTTDKVTPLRFAKSANETLKKHGAKVQLIEFEGGHGFTMPDPAKSFRDALAWLSESGS